MFISFKLSYLNCFWIYEVHGIICTKIIESLCDYEHSRYTYVCYKLNNIANKFFDIASSFVMIIHIYYLVRYWTYHHSNINNEMEVNFCLFHICFFFLYFSRTICLFIYITSDAKVSVYKMKILFIQTIFFSYFQPLNVSLLKVENIVMVCYYYYYCNGYIYVRMPKKNWRGR